MMIKYKKVKDESEIDELGRFEIPDRIFGIETTLLLELHRYARKKGYNGASEFIKDLIDNEGKNDI